MERIRIIPVLLGVIFFAGCSLAGGGTDGGFFRSDDAGKTFAQKIVAEQNKAISALDVLSMAVNPQNANEIYIGTRTAGVFKTDNSGDIWRQLKISQLTPTKIYSLVVNPNDPKIVYATAVISGRGKIVKSQDGGDTWKEIYSEPSQNGLVLALALNPREPQKIYAGTEKGQIIFSEDSGGTWRNLFWNAGNQAIYKIAIDNVNPDLAYFVLFQGGVLRTVDGGINFEKLKRGEANETLPLSQELTGTVSIETDPLRESWLYLGNSEGLLRSKNRGETWEIVKTLNKSSETNIRAIAINPQNPDEIICTVAQAFYKSVDGGVNWMPVQFNTQRSLEVVEYNRQNPSQIFIGMNKR